MLETFQSNNSRDFRQRYQNSWGYFKTESGNRVLVIMKEISDSSAMFEDQRGAKYHAKADQGVEFEFIPVRKRLFIHEGDLYYVSRVPARMWSRGVNSENTSIVNLAAGSWGNKLSFETILSAFASDHAPVEESLGNSSFVLSDMFGVSHGTLYVYNHAIGSWDKEKQTVSVTDPMFEQEVKDLLTKYSLPYRMVKTDGDNT